MDGELEEAAASALETHLRQCEACGAYAGAERASKTLVAATYAVPVDVAGLRARIRERLQTGSAPRRRWTVVRVPRLAWGALAAVLIASLAVGYLTLRPWTAVEASALVRAAVTDHVECMLGRLPLEVTTSDQQEIDRWLQRRLARPVALPTLAPEGTSKMSARVARLANVDGSQILFDRRGRMLSLFIMPAAEVPSVPGRPVAHGGREFFVSQVEGYTVVFWRQGDLVYCLVGEGEVEGVLSLAREYAGSASG
ncbi:MAG: hypothetical protein HYU25_00200 [Candidatus Rokubacteria bacterium]|nr:hypothetical protein [Candidatus Rokubacteria bacterium]